MKETYKKGMGGATAAKVVESLTEKVVFGLSEGPWLQFSNENRDLANSFSTSPGPSQEVFNNTCETNKWYYSKHPNNVVQICSFLREDQSLGNL